MDNPIIHPEPYRPQQHHHHGSHRHHHHGSGHRHSQRRTRAQQRARVLGVAAFILLVILVGIYAWILSERERPSRSGLNIELVQTAGVAVPGVDGV